MVLINLLVAIMGDTWQLVKESADEEWKFLLVQDMEEFFHLHHVPPPFNALALLPRIYAHLADGAFLSEGESQVTRGPLLTPSDLKKKSKVAQLTVQRKQQAEEALTTSAKLSAISRSQVDCAERLEKLSTASAYTNRTISQMLAQVQQQGDESFRPVSVGRPAQPGMRRFSSSPNR